jgi:NAD/NADP transhydrogenase alpha subunit
MRIGVPTEIKNHEYRVGLTPASVRELTTGHRGGVQAGPAAASAAAMPTTWPPAPRCCPMRRRCSPGPR